VALARLESPEPPLSFVAGSCARVAGNAEPGYRFQQRWVVGPPRFSIERRSRVPSRRKTSASADHFGFDFVEIDTRSLDAITVDRKRGASTIHAADREEPVSVERSDAGCAKASKRTSTLFDRNVLAEDADTRDVSERRRIRPRRIRRRRRQRTVFRQPAARLDRSQSALLAAVLPNPTSFRVNAPSRYVRMRQAWILQQMNALGGEHHLTELSD